MTLATMYGFQPEPPGRAPRAWPRFMTARVAADYADSSAWTIRRHVRPCGRRARTFIYSIESVEEWMRGQAPARQAETPVSKRRSNARRDRDARDLAKSDPRDVRCVERNEGCVWCVRRGTAAPFVEPDALPPSICDPKDPGNCVYFCSRLAPDCARITSAALFPSGDAPDRSSRSLIRRMNSAPI